MAALLLMALLPAAAAEGVSVPGGIPAVPTAPPALPGAEAPSGALDIEEHGLVFRGDPLDPDYMRVAAPDGTLLVEYSVQGNGHPRLSIAGSPAVEDLTLVTVEGDPTGDAFTLVLRDQDGAPHRVRVDRAALASNVELPSADPLPVIEVERPMTWPGAPSQPFLLYGQDAEPNHLPAAAMDGTPWLKRSGTHFFVIQIPIKEATFDRMRLVATSGEQSTDVPFSLLRSTDDARAYYASILPSLLGSADGASITVQPAYERRLTPLMMERFLETRNYTYRLDGTGPTVTLSTPATANDFTFAVSWAGTDALSGIGGFNVDYRLEGAAQWTRWLSKAPMRSAAFSGDWGRTYEFRAMALDKVGNPSAPALAKTTIVAQSGPADDVNHPPTARLLTPRGGSLLEGVTSITWVASDPDGTSVTSKLEISDDDGATWRILYSGPAQRADWDTTSHTDGAGYRLRLTVTDGTQQAADAVSGLTVRNVIASAAPSGSTPAPLTPPPARPTSSPEEAQPAGAVKGDATDAKTAAQPGKKSIPAPFVVVAIAAAALAMRRRLV